MIHSPKPVLYGPHWSAYTRTARLALHEKQVGYDLVEVDFASQPMPSEQLARHPFGKVPVLHHGGFVIYETSAICRYIDAAFAGPALQPTAAESVGRMAQLIAILDNYLSDEIRMGYVNEAVIKPMAGLSGDQERIAQAKQAIAKGFAALANCCTGAADYLVGDSLTLADLHAAPLFSFLAETTEGANLVVAEPVLSAWWQHMRECECMAATHVDLTLFAATNDPQSH